MIHQHFSNTDKFLIIGEFRILSSKNGSKTVLVILNVSLVGCVPLKNSFPGIWRYTKYWAGLAGVGRT